MGAHQQGRWLFIIMDEDGDIEQMTFNLTEAKPVVINFKNLSFTPPKKKLFWKKNQGNFSVIDVRIRIKCFSFLSWIIRNKNSLTFPLPTITRYDIKSQQFCCSKSEKYYLFNVKNMKIFPSHRPLLHKLCHMLVIL